MLCGAALCCKEAEGTQRCIAIPPSPASPPHYFLYPLPLVLFALCLASPLLSSPLPLIFPHTVLYTVSSPTVPSHLPTHLGVHPRMAPRRRTFVLPSSEFSHGCRSILYCTDTVQIRSRGDALYGHPFTVLYCTVAEIAQTRGRVTCRCAPLAPARGRAMRPASIYSHTPIWSMHSGTAWSKRASVAAMHTLVEKEFPTRSLSRTGRSSA